MSTETAAQEVLTITSPDHKYTYTTVKGDPLAVRYYTLSNGLTVILSVNKAEPRIQTYIAVKAGSKNDPADHTGLAHYLEHMMFKGTDRFGTTDFATEKKYLDQIDDLYEQYNHTKDEQRREDIYKQIDSVSGIAAHYAIPNEYDKMVTAIGATGTNAFTSVEETVYVNNIPCNQVENWLTIEAERFRNPVFRIFHTELETVYEEKNRGLDNDDVKVDEALMAGIFRKHPYGTQTTIGTVEHLKNPSLQKIKEYYHTYYVPNNMAVIMCGDFDPDTVVAQIDKHFSVFKSKPVPAFHFEPETELKQPIITTVLGPKADEVDLAFRFPGAGTREAMLLKICNSLLYNDKAGLIDLDMIKSQKVLDAGTYYATYKDYSYLMIQTLPSAGQPLEEVKDMLMAEIEKLKKGDFSDDLIQAIINNIKLDDIHKQESNSARTYMLMDAFATGRSRADMLAEKEALKQVTKQDIMNFAASWFTNDYAVVYKRVGEDKNIVKVPKPPITQVTLNRNDISGFAAEMLKKTAPPIQPVFLDYNTAIQKLTLRHDVPLYYYRNTENERFTLYYFLDMGKDNDLLLPIAANYLQFIGTDKYSAEQISSRFYQLAANFGVSAGYDRTYVYLSGLQENFDASLALFEDLLAHAKPDQDALDAMIANAIQERANQKKDKNIVLNRGMVYYAKYGPKNPFNYNLSNDELKQMKAGDLVEKYIKNLTRWQHKVYYYGPVSAEEAAGKLNKLHQSPESLKPVPKPYPFEAQDNAVNKVFFTDFDMVQANIFWVARGSDYSVSQLPDAYLFNEYFGGSMGSIVFQTLRESKALAYSTTSRYETPSRRNDPFFTTAFIGTQADKLNDAMTGMNDLLHEMPKTEILLDNARLGLETSIAAHRIIRNDVLMNYDQALRMGNDHDIRIDVYNRVPLLGMSDLEKFHDSNFKDKKYIYCVLAAKDKIKMEDLEKYGRVEELTLEQIFGY